MEKVGRGVTSYQSWAGREAETVEAAGAGARKRGVVDMQGSRGW
jgi:hypothetical protein